MVTAGMPADVLGSTHSLAMLAATVDRWDDARAHFEEAVAVNERFGVKEWSALARYEYALALAKRTDMADARQMLAQSRVLAETHGMTRIVGMVDTAASELGG